jgi:hypothetical protein
MTDRERIEAQIRQVITAEGSAATLSEKLFSPNGLFNTLAPSDAERQAIVRSELFRDAQARFRQLQISEGAVFARAVEEAGSAFPSTGHRMKLEHVELS